MAAAAAPRPGLGISARQPRRRRDPASDDPRGARRGSLVVPAPAPTGRDRGPRRRFPDPPEWKKHTVYAFGALFVGFLWMGRTSVSLEERPVAPKHNIPSAVWASKTVKPVDDKYKTDPHV